MHSDMDSDDPVSGQHHDRCTVLLVCIVSSLVVCANADNYAVDVVGELEHVSLSWIEGWSCPSSSTFASRSDVDIDTGIPVTSPPLQAVHDNVSVVVYASNLTSVNASTPCFIHDNTTRICLCGNGIANHVRESSVAARCGGSAYRGFHIPTPAELLDGKQHNLYAFAIVAPPPKASDADVPTWASPLSRPREFRGRDIDPSTLVLLGSPFSFNSRVL